MSDTPNTDLQPPVSTPELRNWERDTLEKLLMATVVEQRAARRWGIFFKLGFLFLAFMVLWSFYDFNIAGTDGELVGKHTALIEITGNIEDEGSGSADVVIPSLNKAFDDAESVAVILRINSPGGSPVQAGIIVDEILRMKRNNPNKPLYVVVDEICASGGYYIAAAADRIP